MKQIPFFKQGTDYTCGPAALRMVLASFGYLESEEKLSKEAKTDEKSGTSHNALITICQKRGLHCRVDSQSGLDDLKYFVTEGYPTIVNFVEPSDNVGHYAVVTGFGNGKVVFNDPWNGESFTMGEKDFLDRWYGHSGHRREDRWMMAVSDKEFHIGKQYLPQ